MTSLDWKRCVAVSFAPIHVGHHALVTSLDWKQFIAQIRKIQRGQRHHALVTSLDWKRVGGSQLKSCARWSPRAGDIT